RFLRSSGRGGRTEVTAVVPSRRVDTSGRLLRVRIISRSYAPEPIGIGPLIAELAEGLAAQGCAVDVVATLPNYPARRIFEGYRGRLSLKETRNNVVVRRHWTLCRPRPGVVVRLLDEFITLIGSTILAFRGPRPDVV